MALAGTEVGYRVKIGSVKVMTKPAVVAVSLFIAVSGLSCAGNKPVAQTADTKGTSLAPTNDTPTPKLAAKSTTAAPIAPADARYTLYCLSVDKLGHVERSKALKESLIQRTGMKDFYLVHSDDQSIIYYGYYKDFMKTNDVKERKRAEADRTKIVNLRDDRKDLPFRGALFVTLDAPDPQSPPEWNLTNLAADRMWTLEIGVYVDSPLRKQYAVNAVREARNQGIEAYYFHGENISSVCVGAFKETALARQDSDSAESYRSNETLLVLPGQIPQGMSGDQYVMQDGKKTKVKVIAPRIEVLDPKLKELQERFPHRSVNGEERMTVATNKRTGRTVQVYDESVIVPIPRATGSFSGGVPQPGADIVLPPTATGKPKPQQGGGKLRGLGD